MAARRQSAMDLERCLFLGPAGNRVPRPAEFAPQGRALVEARHVWLMARQWGVLFEVRPPPYAGAPGGAVLPVLGLQQLGAHGPRAPTYRWRSEVAGLQVQTRLWRVSPWQLA